MKFSFSSIIGGILCIGIGVFLLSGSWYAFLDYNRVRDYGGWSSGQVTGKHFQRAADGSGNYYLDYSFIPAAGNKINATSGITKQQWEILQVNDNLEIRYDPANPQRNIPMYGGSPSLVFAFFTLILGIVLMLFGVSRLFNAFQQRKSSN